MLDKVLIHLCLKGDFTMNQFYDSSSLRLYADGSRRCLIQECARDMHLCVKIETCHRCQMLFFSVSHSKGSGDHISLFSILYLIKKKKIQLTFGVLVHFPFLASFIYAISSSSVSWRKEKKTEWRAKWTSKSNSVGSKVKFGHCHYKDNMSGRLPASKPFALLGWTCV